MHHPHLKTDYKNKETNAFLILPYITLIEYLVNCGYCTRESDSNWMNLKYMIYIWSQNSVTVQEVVRPSCRCDDVEVGVMS